MNFTNTLWEHITPLYHQVLQHPFNLELAEGTLERRRFIFYMEQDAYYLIGFARALSFIAARTSSSRNIRYFLDFAREALVVERELHAHFLSQRCCDDIEPSPACMAYTHYLIATSATASLEEAVAAILPCFWLYQEVGCNISASVKECNPYMRWINTYSSQEFAEGTALAISLVNDMASQCSPHLLKLMKKKFEYSALFEWHFWNDAYNMTIFRAYQPEFEVY